MCILHPECVSSHLQLLFCVSILEQGCHIPPQTKMTHGPIPRRVEFASLRSGCQTHFTGGCMSLTVAIKGPNVILGLYKCNYSNQQSENDIWPFQGNPGENEFDTPALGLFAALEVGGSVL